MNVDFAALLLGLTVASGLIWLADSLFFARRRQRNQQPPFLVVYAKDFFPVLFVVLFIRSFIAEPFRIPSSSMMPTLLIGDFILVNKFAYGLRFPAFNTKFLDIGEPQRGDIVVFRYPKDPSQDYIKRIIGLPGDTISYRNHVLYVNGKPMPQKILGIYTGTGQGREMTGAELRLEDLDGVEHQILVDHRVVDRTNGGTWVVPEGHYFAMGDNRDRSSDSRFWGFVPEENLVGKAFFIWMNWDAGIGFSRIGTVLK